MQYIEDFVKTTWNTAKNPIVAAKVIGKQDMSEDERNKMQEIIRPVAASFGYQYASDQYASDNDGRGIIGMAIAMILIIVGLLIVVLVWATYVRYGISTSTSTDMKLRKKAGKALVFALVLSPLAGPLHPIVFLGFLIYAHMTLNKLKASVDLDVPLATVVGGQVGDPVLNVPMGEVVDTSTDIKFGSSSYEL